MDGLWTIIQGWHPIAQFVFLLISLVFSIAAISDFFTAVASIIQKKKDDQDDPRV